MATQPPRPDHAQDAGVGPVLATALPDSRSAALPRIGGPVLAAVFAVGLGYNVLDYVGRADILSGLVSDSLQLLMVFLIGLATTWLLRGRVCSRAVGKSLLGAYAMALASSVINVTDEFAFLNGVPIVGDKTRSNEILEVLLIVLSICFVVRAFAQSLGEMRAAHIKLSEQAAALQREHEGRTEAQRKLSEEGALLRATLESAADGILATDRDLRVTHVNDRFLHMWGLRREDALLDDAGRFFDHVLEQTAKPDRERAALERLKSSDRHEYDTIILADGREFERHSLPLLRDGESAGRVCSFRDVTRQREHEAALRRAKETWERTFDAVPEMICVLDAEGRIEQMNQAMSDKIGLAVGDTLGRSCEELFTNRPEPPAYCPHRQGVLDGKPHDVEVRDDETGTDYHLTTVPIMGAGNEVRGTVHIARDVTARNRAESERIEFERGLQQAQKLEGLGRLAGGIAHDFNNLLVPVLGNADFILADLPADAPSRAHLEDIRGAARRATDLCRQMLAYAGRGGTSMADMDVTKVVAEMEPLLSASLSRAVTLDGQYITGAPRVRGDAGQIKQVVMNLVLNAAESMPDGGRVTLRVEPLDTACWTDDEVRGFVMIEVCDAGEGMDRETQRRMFEPFFSTRFTGRGLGLSTVHGIVRAHQGAISVHSRAGEGTAIRVFLPACKEPEWKRAADALTPEAKDGAVLIVDDEPSVLRIAQRMVERLGYSAVTASNGREAMDVLREGEESVACVLLDLAMPNMDGEAVLKGLKDIDPSLAVVLCSGYADHPMSKRFAETGAAGFISKPFSLGALKDTLLRYAAPDAS